MCSHTEDRVCRAAARQHAVQTGEELGPSNHAWRHRYSHFSNCRFTSSVLLISTTHDIKEADAIIIQSLFCHPGSLCQNVQMHCHMFKITMGLVGLLLLFYITNMTLKFLYVIVADVTNKDSMNSCTFQPDVLLCFGNELGTDTVIIES